MPSPAPRRAVAVAAMAAEFNEHPNSTGRAAALALTPALHREEHKELMAAIAAGDRAAIARELADVAYLAYTEAWGQDIDLDAALVEIHRAAMDKIRANVRGAGGKLAKPPSFREPDMTAALRRGGEASVGPRSGAACNHAYDPLTGACELCGTKMIAVPDTFAGLLEVATRLLEGHYPPDIFPSPRGDTRDPGVQLVTAVRAVVDAQQR